MLLPTLLFLLGAVFYMLYKWSTIKFNTFAERGVPFERPLPFIGNAGRFLKKSHSTHKFMIDLYKKTKQHKIYGFYNLRQPFFIINDPELIKKMSIKDFESFSNHQMPFNPENEPFLSSMLSLMKDQRWKNMRNTITPCFTGAKMRAMFTLMNDSFAECMQYLNKQQEGGVTPPDIDLKECFARLSNDLIATTAFGIKVNSFVDKNNEFFTIGQSFTALRRRILKFMFYRVAPKLFELLKMKIFDQKVVDYFIKLVVDAMKYRKEHNINRPDMIQLLIEAKKESVHQWSEEEIVAQCFIFFFAAFENNAKLLCTVCYELVDNPDIQNKLREEILEVKSKLNGATLDYDTIQKMKYIDMVISETLRKWTLAPMIDRECGKDYTVTDESGNFVCDLKKGDRIWFQVAGLHWAEEYFEDPEIFNPERFSEENKHNINAFTYLPFGVGPRICIGNRYAAMQAKAMLYYLLLEYSLERSEKTPRNLLENIRGFQIDPKDGFWFKLVKLTTTE